IFLDPFDGGGGRRLEKACTELEAVLAIIVPIPARLDELAGGDHGGMADNGDQIPLAARLHTQHCKAVFLVAERDALNEPSEDLGAALGRARFHRELLSTDDPTPSAGTRQCTLFQWSCRKPMACGHT